MDGFMPGRPFRGLPQFLPHDWQSRQLLYLACPYTHPESEVMLARFNEATRVAAEMTKMELNAFSPITHSHPMAAHDVPGNWGFWERIDKVYLSLSYAMVVLNLEGAAMSIGVNAEIGIAKRMNIPVYLLTDGKVSLYHHPWKPEHLPEGKLR